MSKPKKDKVSNMDPKKIEKEAMEADAVRGGMTQNTLSRPDKYLKK